MTRLVRAPEAEAFESPASWLSRVAVSQGARFRELLALLPAKGLDLDVQLFCPPMLEACHELGLEPARLRIAHRVLGNLQYGRLDAKRFLLFDGERPRYRFCPHCVAQGNTVGIPVHWRFACWRACPVHACLMSDRCGSCQALLRLPACMLKAGPRGEGLGFLTYCMECGRKLSATTATPLNAIGLQHWEIDFIANGRATLAALYRGELSFDGDRARHSLRRLTELDRRGMLPNSPTFLSEQKVTRRMNQSQVSSLGCGQTSAAGGAR